MAFCGVTAGRLLKLSIVVCMLITLINGDRRHLTSAADVMVRMMSPLNPLLLSVIGVAEGLSGGF